MCQKSIRISEQDSHLRKHSVQETLFKSQLFHIYVFIYRIMLNDEGSMCILRNLSLESWSKLQTKTFLASPALLSPLTCFTLSWWILFRADRQSFTGEPRRRVKTCQNLADGLWEFGFQNGHVIVSNKVMCFLYKLVCNKCKKEEENVAFNGEGCWVVFVFKLVLPALIKICSF